MADKVALLPSEVPFRKRFEEAVGQPLRERSGTTGGSAVWRGDEYSAGDRSAVSGARGTRATPTGVAADVSRRDPPWEKTQVLPTVVAIWRRENHWFGRERKKETLDEFFQKQLSAFQRSAIRAACVDMQEPFRQSLDQWVPECPPSFTFSVADGVGDG
jgi:hypothetical protein